MGNYPKRHFSRSWWSFSLNDSWLTDTGHSFHTFILHTLTAETCSGDNWYQWPTTSSYQKSPWEISFSSLIIRFCVRKKTDLRVLIFFWFSFSGLQVKIPASCPWLLFVLCVRYSAVAGLKHALLQKPTSRWLATLLTPPTGHHLSLGYRCHLQCSCTTEEGPCLLTRMLEHLRKTVVFCTVLSSTMSPSKSNADLQFGGGWPVAGPDRL